MCRPTLEVLAGAAAVAATTAMERVAIGWALVAILPLMNRHRCLDRLATGDE